MFERILLVCTGNVCRSPVGQALLKRRFSSLCIESAGLNAMVGHGVETTARRLAEADGLDVSHHRARQLTSGMLEEAELILTMSERQRRRVCELTPTARGKTLLFGHWLDDGTGTEIPDPYLKSPELFAFVHERLSAAARSWADRL